MILLYIVCSARKGMSKSPGNCLLLLGMCPPVSVAGAKIVVLGAASSQGGGFIFYGGRRQARANVLYFFLLV